MIRWFCRWADVLINLLSSLAFVYLGALAAAVDPNVQSVARVFGVFWLYVLFGAAVLLGGLSVVLSWLCGYPVNE